MGVGEIAIDEILLESGHCKIQGEPSICEQNEYMCIVSGKCIPARQKCDRVPQCEDGSDENWHAGCIGKYVNHCEFL